jgi:plasmid stabilization system protein ParE
VNGRAVRLSPAVRQDLLRLADFLGERNRSAALRSADLIEAAMLSLAEMPKRGRAAKRPGWRELIVPFGRAAYVIQYRVEPDVVFITRVFHSMERR